MVKIRRLEDDVRRLAAELETDLITPQGPPIIHSKRQSQRRTFLRLLFDAASMILRPVTVLPVNATLSTSMCDASAAPPMDPSEGTVFTTPGGNLSS